VRPKNQYGCKRGNPSRNLATAILFVQAKSSSTPHHAILMEAKLDLIQDDCQE
jgi:hypothetical protein